MKNAKLLKHFEKKNCVLFLLDGKIAINKGATLTNDMKNLININRAVLIEDLAEQNKTFKNLITLLETCENWFDLECLLEKSEKLWGCGAISVIQLLDLTSKVSTESKTLPNNIADKKTSKVDTALKIELVTKEIDGEVVSYPKSWDT